MTSVTVRGVPLTVDPKAILSITAVLENRGLADAATSGLKFVLVDSSGAPTKHLTGKFSAAGLLAGTTVTVQGRAKVVAAAPPGVYRVQACADSGKKVDENNENNNCTTAPGTVTVTGPALAPAALAFGELCPTGLRRGPRRAPRDRRDRSLPDVGRTDHRARAPDHAVTPSARP